jgi:hypothetical protein
MEGVWGSSFIGDPGIYTTVYGDEAALSIETWGGSFTRDSEGREWKKVLEMGVSLYGGPLGNLGSPSTGNFRDGWRAPEREHLSLWELCWRGSSLGIQKEGSGDRHHSLVIGGPFTMNSEG